MLRVNDTDMFEFFEREPELGEDGIWMIWKHAREGVELELTIWPYDRDVLISLRQVAIENELLDYKILGATRVEVYNEEKRPFIEIEYPAGETTTGSKFTRVARLFISPQIHVAITEN